MADHYPIYIPSKGRHDVRKTAEALERMGCRYHIIVEEQEADLYRATCKSERGATVLVLPDRYKDEYEHMDDLGRTKSSGPGPARNFAWDHSIETYGAKRHWVMDDNIRKFSRLNKNNKEVEVLTPSFWAAMGLFVDRYANVAMAGPNYAMFAKSFDKLPPFIANTRIYSCNLILNSAPFRWRGRYNEDTILSLDMLTAGWCTLQFNAFLQKKIETQQVKGGNTAEFYAREGTWPKSEMLVRAYPEVARHVVKYGRDHHHVDYRPFKRNRLVRAPDYDARVAEAAALGLRLVERAALKGRPDA
jgi:hypothetical protein